MSADSPTFCILPWIQMIVETDGRVLPCCVADVSKPLGNVRQSKLENVWNSEKMRGIRRNMLAGRENPECANCYELERSGIWSHRQQMNGKFLGRHADIVRRTSPDGRLEPFRMPCLDIRFSNICNFRCRTCGPSQSSAWKNDAQALGWHDEPAGLSTAGADPEDFWREVEPLIPHAEYIHFAGGEPLLMEEHYRILDELVARKLFHVKLDYNTNFSVLSRSGRDIFALWKRFENVHVGASLDGMGRRGEYLRKGQVWDEVERNVRRMSSECPRVNFNLNVVVSLMNALHLPDFHRTWIEKGLLRDSDEDAFHLQVLLDPAEYRLQVLPEIVKERVAESYTRHMEEVLKPRGINPKMWESALRFMWAEDLSHLLPAWRECTARLDELREERFAEVFPELAPLLMPTRPSHGPASTLPA